MRMESETLCRIALTMIHGVGMVTARTLLAHLGSASAIFNESTNALLKIEGIGRRTVEEIKSGEALKAAEAEYSFIDKNKIRHYFITDDNYPQRLRECPDAPLMLYAKGEGALSSSHVVSIVGTRHASEYGLAMCSKLIEGLSTRLPDLIVYSGLAFGIDVAVHRACLEFGVPTIGVLAHGLDRIYPWQHRPTAVSMIENGGLLTEFPSGTQPCRANFVMRNRIVAGISDVTIVVESPEKGGAMITANIASSYNRELCAIPGRVSDVSSAGCNKLIVSRQAEMIRDAEDLLQFMNWDLDAVGRNAPVQRQLFVELSEEEESVMKVLEGGELLQVDDISRQIGVPVYILSSILLELEFKGVVKCLTGGRYQSLL